jgi:hypothetical protein
MLMDDAVRVAKINVVETISIIKELFFIYRDAQKPVSAIKMRYFWKKLLSRI